MRRMETYCSDAVRVDNVGLRHVRDELGIGSPGAPPRHREYREQVFPAQLRCVLS